MNKVIKGKKYNTETAKEICDRTSYCNGTPSSWTTLYQKKTGEFFIARISSGMNCWDTENKIPCHGSKSLIELSHNPRKEN